MLTTEHILLESDLREVPDLQNAREVHAATTFRSRLRRRVVQLEIIDYYYLSVRSRSRAGGLDYVLDLRFAHSPPQLSRRIAWRWVGLSVLLIAALATAITARTSPASTPWWQHHWLAVCAALLWGWLLATLAAAYRTTETLRLLSTFGAARLLELTGGVGTFRTLRHFAAKLAAHLQIAASARRATKAEHLRDEMREHLRLKELGVLTVEEYEASKVRILEQHSRTARTATGRAAPR
jgi:hypothetical protein